MRTVTLKRQLSDAATDALLTKQLAPGDWDEELIFKGEDVRAVDADTGELIFVLRRGAIPLVHAIGAMRALEKFNHKSDNRGTATKSTAAGFKRLKSGVLSKVRRINIANLPVSGIVGYFDRSTRFPFCRQTAFTQHNFGDYVALYPLLRCVSGEFAMQVPDRWHAQLERWKVTATDFKIPDTVFTTITINKNYPTAVHLDAGDLKEGFSCLAVLRKGKYTGGYTCFPRYKAGVSLDSTDVVFMNAHEHHGNSPIEKLTAGAERIALVMYYRERMADCLDGPGELARAQNRQAGDPLHEAKK